MYPRIASLALTLTVVLSSALGACVTEPDAPTEEELAGLDSWAGVADGKADLPQTWSKVVAWLRDVYTNQMSAIWKHQEHPATPAAAIARIRTVLAKAGIADPSRTLFNATVQRLRTDVLDHSEIDITLAPGKVVRLVGDPKGAGAFFDAAPFQTAIGAELCLTWTELQTAITTSYLPGAYGVNFVCHTVTERVLRALHAGSSTYAAELHTYQAARWIWGPVVPSGNPQDPEDWAVSRACPAP